ncbi:hypothetical protein F5878DRAFT_619023 [Lentinula raphanica]|uniref:NmrA-like domain-containing protein n=1 Tax=Lentinula raphanica TaxID=153919 RepID=A0AA38P996_9AGAR|nr:hypothetical protein F5880DRAFT_1286783 [Lentinula raphanica]KAJ3838655.1 hypothetical protein F5878DRAFT_619023 [Lentinula raphanica]
MSISKRSVALVGVGAIGTPILRAFLNNPNHPTVIVLTRPESKTKDIPAELSPASRIAVDYTDIDTLASVFREHSIEVVVSALPPPGYKAQYALADAAKASGTVKLFVPSEWGSPTEGAKEKGEENIFAVKDGVAEYLVKIGLPYTRFFTGLFMGYVPWVVGSDVDGNVHIQGKGDTPFSVTSQEDIGGFVAHVLTSLPLDSPELVNACLRIQGQQITLRQFARVVNKPIVTVPREELIPGSSREEQSFKAFLQSHIEEGMAVTGWDHKSEKVLEGATGSANKLWEGHVWQTIGSTF